MNQSFVIIVWFTAASYGASNDGTTAAVGGATSFVVNTKPAQL
jgi:hypothetical protein